MHLDRPPKVAREVEQAGPGDLGKVDSVAGYEPDERPARGRLVAAEVHAKTSSAAGAESESGSSIHPNALAKPYISRPEGSEIGLSTHM